ncbi:MAG: pitrilysin family protein [Candidatus Pacebacteria bacterium]|nr:pitrilysin family protein [Candidatus Paceibacterota bacterium]
MYKKINLKNGLRIITVPAKNTQAVTVLVLVGTGSKYETKKINGISHFLEHMYFSGTKKRPSTIAVAETLDKVGGIYNAFTSEEYTGYFAKVDSAYFEIALDWVSDIFLNSLLPEKELKKEKGVIIEEINMYQDQPMSYVRVLWQKILYGDQPAGRSVAGTKESVSGIERKDLLNYMESQYVAKNTIVCVAGNIKEEESIEKVKKYFSKMRESLPKPKPKVFEKQTRPEVLAHFRQTDQTHLCLGARAYNIFHPKRYAQEILGTILGGGGMMSSRLFEEVRTKLGIAYYVDTDIDDNTDTGCLVTQAGVDNSKVEKAISTILREYKRISQTEVPKAELKKAKDNMKGKLSLLLETSDAKASFYAGQELLEKKILTPEKIFEKIDKISADDILKVGRDIFQPKNLNLALIGPFKEKEKFERLLKF